MFFLFILIIVLALCLIVHTIKIEIDIKNLEIDTEKPKGQRVNKESSINAYIVIFEKIKIFKKDVKMQRGNLDIKLLKKKDMKVNYLSIIKGTRIDIKQIDLYAEIGTQDAALTAILVGTVSGILGGIVRKPKYQVIPIYSNKNLLKIKLDSIFTVDLRHYIYKQILKRKGRVDKNERTSNREFNDDCYE